jgi:hypothetical protein
MHALDKTCRNWNPEKFKFYLMNHFFICIAPGKSMRSYNITEYHHFPGHFFSKLPINSCEKVAEMGFSVKL